MNDLTAFLTARLDEDEAVAKAAASCTGPDWHQSHAVTANGATTIVFNGPDDDIEVADTLRRDDQEIAPFIARHDPARALREVEAKRALVRRCEQQAKREFDNAMEEDRTWVLWPVLFELAAIWSDHPDYDQAWKPS